MSRPVYKVKIGGVSASIFENKNEKNGKEYSTFTVVIDRTFKDMQTNQWKNSNSFTVNDLQKVAIVAAKAYEHLMLTVNISNGEDDNQQGAKL